MKKKLISKEMVRRNILKLSGTLLIAATTAFNSAAQKTESRQVGEFTGISASGAVSVYITQGNTNSLKIEADEAILKDVKTEVKSGVLRISDEHDYKWFNGEKHSAVKAYVTVKTLNSIDLSGASSCKGETIIKTNKMDIDVSGASNMTLIVETNTIDVDASGASNIKISGTTKTSDVDASGASRIKAFELKSSTAKVIASGASTVEINTSEDLQGHASGASTIVYKGSHQRKNVSESGASTVNQISN